MTEPSFEARKRMYDIMKQHDLWQRVFHPLPDNLEAGSVQLIDVMPRMVPEQQTCDNAIAHMARVSYGQGTSKVSNDIKLIRRLMRDEHDSPFEGIVLKFRVRLPIFVYRQWFRHRSTDQSESEIILPGEIVTTDETARKYASMNEYSARYSVVPDIFYIPHDLRVQSQTNRQGGSELLEKAGNEELVGLMTGSAKKDRELYEILLARGVSRELARSILPVCYITEFYFVANILNLFRWLRLRWDPHAQQEIRAYAGCVAAILEKLVPNTLHAFENYVLRSVRLSWEEQILLQELLPNFISSPDDHQKYVAKTIRDGYSEADLQTFYTKLRGSKMPALPHLEEFQSSIPPFEYVP